jgi:heptosyltransferase-1
VRALLVRLSSIGDVVHTLPALAALGRAGWEAGWLVEPLSRPLLLGLPCLRQVVPAPPARAFRLASALDSLGALRRERYSVALDFQGLWKSAAWARLSGGHRVIGFSSSWRREPASTVLLNERVALPTAAVHVIDKNLALLRALGIETLGQREFPLPRPQATVTRVAAGLRDLGLRRFVILNPGGGWASKLWPAEAFGVLAQGLLKRGLRSLVSFGPGEEDLAARVVAASSGAAVRSFPTTLVEYLELARQAALVVAADTGPLHLACAVGTPVVALFGPTDPTRNGPFASEDRVVRVVPPCAPCHKRRCKTHQWVMERIAPEDVIAAVDARLALSGEVAPAV